MPKGRRTTKVSKITKYKNQWSCKHKCKSQSYHFYLYKVNDW